MLSDLTAEQLLTCPEYRVMLAIAKTATWKAWCGVSTYTEALQYISLDEAEGPFTYPLAYLVSGKAFGEYPFDGPGGSGSPRREYVMWFKDETGLGQTLDSGKLAIGHKVRSIREDLLGDVVTASFLNIKDMTIALKQKEVERTSVQQQIVTGALYLIVGFR